MNLLTAATNFTVSFARRWAADDYRIRAHVSGSDLAWENMFVVERRFVRSGDVAKSRESGEGVTEMRYSPVPRPLKEISVEYASEMR